MQESESKSDKQKLKATVGVDDGLKLTLDLHSNNESFGTILQDFAAFRVFIGHPSEFPTMKRNSLLVEPGKEHFLSLSSEVLSAQGIKNLDPKDRKCYFPNEGSLEFYEKYTFQNCNFECAAKIGESQLGCTPWFLPHSSNSTICDPWAEREFLKHFGKSHHSAKNGCGMCLPDCEDLDTTVVASSAKFR